jgi:hypothetical protein
MNIAENCGVAAFLFFAAIAFAIIGNLLGIVAWRQRADGQARSRWLIDPLYLLRGRNFRHPRHPARFVALALLSCGVICLAILVFALIKAQRSGLSGVCGFSF